MHGMFRKILKEILISLLKSFRMVPVIEGCTSVGTISFISSTMKESYYCVTKNVCSAALVLDFILDIHSIDFTNFMDFLSH